MANKRSTGMLFVILGLVLELVAIVLMVTRVFAPALGIALLGGGTGLLAIGLATLRRDRDEHGLKKPANSGM